MGAVDNTIWKSKTADTAVLTVPKTKTSVICFTTGTMILTDRGERTIEDLRQGDFVVTRDSGLQPIRWIGQKTVEGKGKFAPVRIAEGLFGNDRPLLISPQHRMLHEGYDATLLFAEREVMISAEHLINGTTTTTEEMAMVTYFHILLDRHEVIFANGAATESYQPCHESIATIDAKAREELFSIFPELRADPSHYGDTARMVLRPHESIALYAAA